MRRHPFDALSFPFGAISLLAGVMLLTGGQRGISLVWVGPVAAIAIGVVIALAARSSERGDGQPLVPDGES